MSSSVRFWALLVAVLVITALVVGNGDSDSNARRLDPRSVGPEGARGLVETLEALGATVTLDQAVPDQRHTSAIMLRNQVSRDDEQRLEEWVRSGGVLVVADLASALSAESVATTTSVFGDEDLTRNVCTIETLQPAERLQVEGRMLAVDDRQSCFGDGVRAFIVAENLGSGLVVTVGSPDVFVNSVLGQQDAAVIAANLLVPNRGRSVVAFVGPSIVEFGEQSLRDLVPPRVENAIMQLLAAFLLYALYRGRRLGAVSEQKILRRLQN